MEHVLVSAVVDGVPQIAHAYRGPRLARPVPLVARGHFRLIAALKLPQVATFHRAAPVRWNLDVAGVPPIALVILEMFQSPPIPRAPRGRSHPTRVLCPRVTRCCHVGHVLHNMAVDGVIRIARVAVEQSLVLPVPRVPRGLSHLSPVPLRRRFARHPPLVAHAQTRMAVAGAHHRALACLGTMVARQTEHALPGLSLLQNALCLRVTPSHLVVTVRTNEAVAGVPPVPLVFRAWSVGHCWACVRPGLSLLNHARTVLQSVA